LTFCRKLSFQKTLDWSMDFPWISHPMNFRGGRGSGRQKTRLTRPARRPDQRADTTSAR
jgi:hypothetical protein